METPMLLNVRLCNTLTAMITLTPCVTQQTVLQTANECKKAGAPAVEVYPCDGTSAKGIDDLCKTLLDKHSCMDVVVHSAGIFPMSGQTPLEGKTVSCMCCPQVPLSNDNTSHVNNCLMCWNQACCMSHSTRINFMH